MTFKKFNFIILFQLLLIATNNFIIAWTIIQEHLTVSSLYFLIILVIQILFLFFYITKQNKEIIRFLEAVKHRDEFSKLSEKETTKSHRELRRLLNEISESYSQVKIEKESEHFYFLNTIKHVNVGLISFDENGKIELINDAMKQLLKVDHISNISVLVPIFNKTELDILNIPQGKAQLIKLKRDNEILQLSVHATSFFVKDHEVTLVSMQDIRNEIQKEEIDIWQKLIRVLTHEIMNSAGPITSLSSTITDTFKEDIKPHKIGEKLYNQIIIGLKAIQKRSHGLAKFVETYRNLTKLPKPIFTSISGYGLLMQLQVLMQEELDLENIALYFDTDPKDIKMTVDEKMFTQVLINLLKNSIPALKGRENKTIKISISKPNDATTHLVVEDNGKGIPDEVLERIFVPFFTTREDGSGIGLSLSRQIISLHGGSLNIRSKENEGTMAEIIL